MTVLLKSKPLVEMTTELLKKKCTDLVAKGIKPKLKVILVGEDPASKVYVGHKEKMAAKFAA